MECWSLSNIDQSPDAFVSLLILGTHPHIYPLPGCILVHTSTGVYALDPITLTPMTCKMLRARDGNSDDKDEGIDDGIPRPQFDIANCTLTILSVFDINWSSSKDKQNTDDSTADNPCSTTVTTKVDAINNQSDFSYVAMKINKRLILMKITTR